MTTLTEILLVAEDGEGHLSSYQGALPQPFRRGSRVLPTSYVIDRDGYIRDFFIGSRDYQELAARVKPYL